MGQSPALRWVTEVTNQSETQEVVNKSSLLLPGQLNELVVPQREAFPKESMVEGVDLEDLARLQIYFANRRPSPEPGTFVEASLMEYESLSEGIRIVRVGADYLGLVY